MIDYGLFIIRQIDFLIKICERKKKWIGGIGIKNKFFFFRIQFDSPPKDGNQNACTYYIDGSMFLFFSHVFFFVLIFKNF